MLESRTLLSVMDGHWTPVFLPRPWDLGITSGDVAQVAPPSYGPFTVAASGFAPGYSASLQNWSGNFPPPGTPFPGDSGTGIGPAQAQYTDWVERTDASNSVTDATAIPDGPHIRLTGMLAQGDVADYYKLPVPDSSMAIRLQLRLSALPVSLDVSGPPSLVMFDSTGLALPPPTGGQSDAHQLELVISPSRSGAYQGELVFGVTRTSTGGGGSGVGWVGGGPVSGSADATATATSTATAATTAAAAAGSSSTSGAASQSAVPYQLLIDRVVSPDPAATTGSGSAGAGASANNGLALLSGQVAAAGWAIGLSGSSATTTGQVPGGLSLSGAEDTPVVDAGKIDTKAPLKGAAPFGGVLDDGPSVESLSGDALAGIDLTELPVHAVSDAFDPVRGLVPSSTEPNCDPNAAHRDQPVGATAPPKPAQKDEGDALWPVRHFEWLPAPILARDGAPTHGRASRPDLAVADESERGTDSAEIQLALPPLAEAPLDIASQERGRLSLWRTGLAFSCVLAFTTLLPEFTFWLKSKHPGQTRRRRVFRSSGSRSGRPGSTGSASPSATP
jgi:hypothetical protein